MSEFETGGGITKGATLRVFDVPDYTSEIIRLKKEGPTQETILKIIEKHSGHRARMLKNYDRYKTNSRGIPIFSRQLERDVTTDRKLNFDYVSEIVDMKTGYFAGSAASYSYDKETPEFKTAKQQLADFFERNRIADINMETTKYCAIAGYSARLIYTDKAGDDRLMYIPGHQAILLNEDGNIIETEFAIRYYGDESGYIIHFYDETTRYKYQQDGTELQLIEQASHNFSKCPLFGYPNNDELMGDPDKVLEIIDAVDRTLSDVNSEIESFRLAYMIFYGIDINQEILDQMMKTGALGIPAMPGERPLVDYLTKNLNDNVIENHLNRLHSAIYRFSGTPDLSDEAFSGNSSGVALKFKLFGLETKCARFEQKFRAADTRMCEILATKWKIAGITFNPFKVISEFKRNFPLDLLYEIDVLSKSMGVLSEQTRLGLASFIDDVDYEMKQMEAERDAIEPLDLNQTKTIPSVSSGATADGIVSR